MIVGVEGGPRSRGNSEKILETVPAGAHQVDPDLVRRS
jgi:multimeric flavodoxin WrbA